MTTKPSDTGDTSNEIELASTEASREVAVDDGLEQWAFTAPFEGIIDHLYLDTRGNVTCGVGFLIANREALDRFDWKPDVLTARGDYDRVRTAKSGQLARTYKMLCQATLTPETMRVHFDAHVQMVMGQLMGTWKLSELPRPVRVALIDMAFNLGVGGLNKYLKLKAAIAEKRWADAAAECSRKGIQASRNQATRDLFMSLVPSV